MATITKKEFISGSIWKITEQFSAKGISLLMTIILARILAPEVHGLIALTTVFTNLSDILIDGGFSTALIRKNEVDDIDYSSVLVTSISVATVLYIILFFSAPCVASYYHEPELTAVLRVIGLTFFIQAFTCVRTVIINRNMQFKLLFQCNFLGTLISGFIGIIAAYLGMGVWSLVIQRLLQQALLTIFILFRVHFNIEFQFRFTNFKEIFKFSLGIVTASIINYLSSSLYSLVVGKKYSVADLGYSDKGAQLPRQLALYTFGAMSNVLLPTLSSYQSDLGLMKRIVRKVVRMTAFLITPLMVGLALVSNEVITLLFASKWLPSAPILRAYCLYYYATPFIMISTQVFIALGYSELSVRTEIIRMILQIGSIVLFGIVLGCTMNQLAWVCAAVTVIAVLITFAKASPMIQYSFRELFLDISKPTVAALIMCGSVLLMKTCVVDVIAISSCFLSLVLKATVGLIVYVLISLLMRTDGLNEVMGMLKSIRSKIKIK